PFLGPHASLRAPASDPEPSIAVAIPSSCHVCGHTHSCVPSLQVPSISRYCLNLRLVFPVRWTHRIVKGASRLLGDAWHPARSRIYVSRGSGSKPRRRSIGIFERQCCQTLNVFDQDPDAGGKT